MASRRLVAARCLPGAFGLLLLCHGRGARAQIFVNGPGTRGALPVTFGAALAVDSASLPRPVWLRQPQFSNSPQTVRMTDGPALAPTYTTAEIRREADAGRPRPSPAPEPGVTAVLTTALFAGVLFIFRWRSPRGMVGGPFLLESENQL
jgi:hypothetical protein